MKKVKKVPFLKEKGILGCSREKYKLINIDLFCVKK